MVSKLAIRCDKCQVSLTCPKKGSSPVIVGKEVYLCQIVGGYGRKPVEESILSEESKKLVEKNGPSLTIAEIPFLDTDSGLIKFEVTKIFHKPILNERERSDYPVHMIYPKSHS